MHIDKDNYTCNRPENGQRDVVWVPYTYIVQLRCVRSIRPHIPLLVAGQFRVSAILTRYKIRFTTAIGAFFFSCMAQTTGQHRMKFR